MLSPPKEKQQLADLGCVFRQTVPKDDYTPDRHRCDPIPPHLFSIYSQSDSRLQTHFSQTLQNINNNTTNNNKIKLNTQYMCANMD